MKSRQCWIQPDAVLLRGILNTDMKSRVDFGDGFVYMRVDYSNIYSLLQPSANIEAPRSKHLSPSGWRDHRLNQKLTPEKLKKPESVKFISQLPEPNTNHLEKRQFFPGIIDLKIAPAAVCSGTDTWLQSRARTPGVRTIVTLPVQSSCNIRRQFVSN